MITVGELIEQLKELDPKTPVITSIDDEGNGYRHSGGVDSVFVQAEDYADYRIESVFDSLEEIEDYLGEAPDASPVVCALIY